MLPTIAWASVNRTVKSPTIAFDGGVTWKINYILQSCLEDSAHYCR